MCVHVGVLLCFSHHSFTFLFTTHIHTHTRSHIHTYIQNIPKACFTFFHKHEEYLDDDAIAFLYMKGVYECVYVCVCI